MRMGNGEAAMNRERVLKWVAVVSLLGAVLTFCSSAETIRNLKEKNRQLIDANIRLQAAVRDQGDSRPAAMAVPVPAAPASESVPATEAPPATPATASAGPVAGASLQHLEQDGLVIDVKRTYDGSTRFCTKVAYQGEPLFDECYSKQPRYAVLGSARFGLPVFREEWQLDRDAPNDTSSGVTFWAVEDGELLQALRLPTSRTLPACEGGDAAGRPCPPQHWLKASVQLREESPPAVAWRYLTEAGESAELIYRWEKNRFVAPGSAVAAAVLKRYGF